MTAKERAPEEIAESLRQVRDAFSTLCDAARVGNGSPLERRALAAFTNLDRIEADLRSAREAGAKAERERISAELREKADRMRKVSAETIAPALGFAAAEAFYRFADRLEATAPEGK